MLNKVLLTGPCYISKFDDPERDVVKFQIKQKPFKDADKEYLPCEAWDSKFKQLATQIREHFGETADRGAGRPIEIEGHYRSRRYQADEGSRTITYVEVERWTFPARDYSVENAPSADGNDGSALSSDFPF